MYAFRTSGLTDSTQNLGLRGLQGFRGVERGFRVQGLGRLEGVNLP